PCDSSPSLFFSFQHPPPTETYTLSLHDALPIFRNTGEAGPYRIFGARILEADSPFSLAPIDFPVDVWDEAWELPVVFRAEETGEHRATLAIETGIPGEPVVEVEIRAYVPEPGCEGQVAPPVGYLGLGAGGCSPR